MVVGVLVDNPLMIWLTDALTTPIQLLQPRKTMKAFWPAGYENLAILLSLLLFFGYKN